MNDGEFFITYSYIDNSANAFPPGIFGNFPGVNEAAEMIPTTGIPAPTV